MNGKFLSECEITNYLEDKFLVVTKSGGEDYKISYADLLANLRATFLRSYLKSRIGQIHINTNNKYRDSLKYNDGYLEYLMLNGQEINKNEYPDLFNELGIKEERYTLPNYWQEDGGCTIKHVKPGSGRGLNSYERDELKNHAHALQLNNIETEPFDIDLNHTHFFEFEGGIGPVFGNKWTWQKGVFTRNITADAFIWSGGGINERFVDIFIKVAQHTHGSTKPRSEPIKVKVKPYSGYTAPSGHKETTGKNMAVQCYIVAKVLV